MKPVSIGQFFEFVEQIKCGNINQDGMQVIIQTAKTYAVDRLLEQLIPRARQVAVRIKDAYFRSQMFCSIAELSSDETDLTLAEEAAGQMGKEWRFCSPDMAYQQLAESYAAVGRPEDALRVARTLQGEHRSLAFKAAAVALAKADDFKIAFHYVHEETNDNHWSSSSEALCEVIVEYVLKKASQGNAYVKDAREKAERIGVPAPQARAYAELYKVTRELGDLKQARSAAALVKNDAERSWTYTHLASITKDTDDVESSRKAARLLTDDSASGLRCSCFVKLAKVTDDPADIEEARTAAREKGGGAHSLIQVVELTHASADIVAARESAKKEFGTFRAQNFALIARISRDLNDLDTARAAEKKMDRSEGDVAEARTSIAETYALLDEYQQAYDFADAIVNDMQRVKALLALYKVLQQKKKEKTA